ncbi:MAG: DegT/DnrJ/EryC1/StrS family aminotransferase [Spirochaetales bacterium]|nr:MAG: DegT/DnrJ/EryC1/StrS family aminotransferase [Spirochaetales bacterium]
MEKITIKHELETAYGNIYGKEEEEALIGVLRNGAPSCGKKVKAFEDAFAAYCGTRYALTVTSATTGLTLAGLALGIGPGDEVITTPLSWIATSTAFSALGATLKFCDVDPKTLNLDPVHLEKLITPRTKAIVPVHLFGQCCDMDGIMGVAEKHGVKVIEDCAHNPGGEYKGRKSGSLGHMGVFSFHQQKNMCTLGEGGMFTTSDRTLFEKVLSYRSLCCRIYGPSDKYLSIDESVHPMEKEYWKLFFDDIGYNFRMTDAQAAVGLEQLKKLDTFNTMRRERAAKLSNMLGGVKGITLPWIYPEGKHTFHLYMIQLAKDFPLSKADFMWELYTKKGIKVWSHYMPIHLTDPYRARGHKEGECPVLEEAVKHHVTLPMHPRLTDEALTYMADAVKSLC